ncbi:hypothetical protein N7465_002897 [Penicillium sp. CMV-2018d]|nr:hypothetical protein N7465_002897 [Penicillium sp. CMV-2018d]
MQKSTRGLKTGWSMKQAGDISNECWIPVENVPSQVHIDLIANKKIPHPFVDANELAVQWIAEKDWIYRTKFTVPSSKGTTTDLIFLGLDTFATVTLNGTTILESENMHTSHRVNVSEVLRAGPENELQIVFQSALLRGRELVDQHPDHIFHVRQTEASRIPVRKAQYNWGWDWGPILMTAGPWRPVVLEQYTARIEDVWAQYEISADNKTCSGTLYARVGAGAQEGDTVLLSLFSADEAVFEQECHIGADGLCKKKDEFGKSFYFRINGIDIFAGGSCWIPADSYLAKVSKDRYLDWMKLMVESNQIMIRVWGGGIYEDDAFMEACDTLGILVWHDFAFVCASYPVYPSFLKSIEEEVRQNIRRLRSHPSLVIWAGNNEDYQVQERYKLEYNQDDTDPESWRQSTFPARYIYEHLLPKWLQEEDPSSIYHPGSPWGDGKHTTDPTVGDIHQWNIWHGQMCRYQDSADLGGRFVSEFGMEAYPHLESLRRVITDPQQQHPGSMMMDFRNKAADHERRLMTYVAENFIVPSDLASFTHITQVLQAETMRYAYKAWRRNWGQPGARRCGGVLVWQLNDCWPTMSWAVVDYYLVKKPAFYAIFRALRPLDVGISRSCPVWTSGHADPMSTNSCEFDLWIASSRQDAVEVEIKIRFISIRSGKLVSDTIDITTLATPNSTTEVLEKQRVKVSMTCEGADYKNLDPFIIHAELYIEGLIQAADTAWPQPLKYLDFSNRNVRVKASPSQDEITVSADLPVKGFVFEEREGLKLSDNGFDLIPGEKKIIILSGQGAATTELPWTYVGAKPLQLGRNPKL